MKLVAIQPFQIDFPVTQPQMLLGKKQNKWPLLSCKGVKSINEYCLFSWFETIRKTWEHAQLMMTIFTMVRQKKGRGSRGTLTIMAVMMKTNMMTARLPNTRKRWDILKKGKKRKKIHKETEQQVFFKKKNLLDDRHHLGFFKQTEL